MGLLTYRNPLAYPGGAPRWDPTHFAVGGQPGFSVVAGVGTNSLRRLDIPTAGSPNSSFSTSVDVIGPVIKGVGNAYIEWVNGFTGGGTTGTQGITFAYIGRWQTALALVIATQDGSSRDIGIGSTASNSMEIYNGGTVASISTSGIAANNDPVFVVASVGGGGAGSVSRPITMGVLNLRNGIKTITSTTGTTNVSTGTANVYTLNYWLGNAGVTSNIAAITALNNFLSARQVALWMQAPWEFWYPPIQREIQILGISGTPPAQTLSPSYITDTDTFFAPTVAASYSLSPGLVSDSDTFYSPSVAANYPLSPSLYDDSANDSFYIPTTSPGPVTLSPGLVSDTDVFYSPSISFGLSPNLVTDSAEAFYTPTISLNLTPGLVSDSDAFYAPSIAAVLNPSLVNDSSNDIFYSPTVTPGATTLHPSLFAADDLFYSPTLSAIVSQSVQPAHWVDTDTFYALVVSKNNQLQPSLFAPADVIFTSKVSPEVVVPLFVDTDTFYSPVVKNNATLHPPHFTDPETIQPGEVFFQTSVSIGGGGGTVTGLPNNIKYASPVIIPSSSLIVGLGFTSTTANAIDHWRMAVYADVPATKVNQPSTPGALLGFTTVVTGIISGQQTTTIFQPTGGISVLAGAKVWVAFVTDGDVNWTLVSSPNGSVFNTNTFTQGFSNPFGKASNDNKTAPLTAVLLLSQPQTLISTLYDDSPNDSVYATTVSTQDVLLAPLVDDTPIEAVIQPVVAGEDDFEPQQGIFTDQDVTYSPSIGTFNTIQPLLVDDTPQDFFFAPIVSAYSPQISSAEYDSDDLIYTPEVQAQGANLLPSLFTDVDIFYSSVVSAVSSLVAGLVDDSLNDQIYSPTVLAGWNISPPLVDDTQYEFIWPPSVAVVNTNFTLYPPFIQEGDIIWQSHIAIASPTAGTFRTLIADESGREQALGAQSSPYGLIADESGRKQDLDGGSV